MPAKVLLLSSVGWPSVARLAAGFAHAGCSVDAKRWPRLAAYVGCIHDRPSFKSAIEKEIASFNPA